MALSDGALEALEALRRYLEIPHSFPVPPGGARNLPKHLREAKPRLCRSVCTVIHQGGGVVREHFRRMVTSILFGPTNSQVARNTRVRERLEQPRVRERLEHPCGPASFFLIQLQLHRPMCQSISVWRYREKANESVAVLRVNLRLSIRFDLPSGSSLLSSIC